MGAACSGCCDCNLTPQERLQAREREDRINLRTDERDEQMEARNQAIRAGSISPSAPLTWSCAVCTLENNQTTKRCDACGTPRGGGNTTAVTTPTHLPAPLSMTAPSVVVVQVTPTSASASGSGALPLLPNDQLQRQTPQFASAYHVNPNQPLVYVPLSPAGVILSPPPPAYDSDSATTPTAIGAPGGI